jgi:hypothetical protein
MIVNECWLVTTLKLKAKKKIYDAFAFNMQPGIIENRKRKKKKDANTLDVLLHMGMRR